MVICKYFQNGSCRFGTKCINEHFDFKPIIKSEVEAALKGSQWPLSCFGPFKEKMCIPNFIEDQSFEETRYLCYEAKKNNCFPQFAQQFNQQVMEAQNKMKTLLTLNRDVIAAVTIAYNNIPPGVVNNANNSDSTSFFGNSNSTQPNPFSNSLFRNPTSSNETNVFERQSTTSTSSNTNNMLGQNNFGTGFGSSSQCSLFGQQTNSFKQPSGSFFSVEPQQQQPSIFQSQPLTFSNTGFGTNPQVNLFGQPQPQQQSLNTGNVFTQQNQQQSEFGNHNQMRETPQAQQAFEMQQSAPTAGIFGQVQTQTQQQQQQQDIFKQALNQQQNISDMQQQPQQQQMNLFGSVQPPSLASSFGNTQQQQNIQTQNISASSMFTQEGLQQQPQQMVTFFNQSQQQQSNFQPTGNVQSTFYPNGINIDDIPISGNLYTKLEFLKPEEIEAFKADKFEIGRIPVNPPARELVQYKY